MLTRIEIDGFKTFENFALDVQPLTAIVGPNAKFSLNTHSPKVMAALQESEIIAADSVIVVDPDKGTRATRTRMRSGIQSISDLLDPDIRLSRFEIDKLLQRPADAA